jgi:hypothetical protein
MEVGKVIKRSVNDNAVPKGIAHSNPILYSRKYVVEFGDGEVLEYSANVIAQNSYAQVDSEGKRYLLMDSIIDHIKDHIAVLKQDEFVIVNGKRQHKKTTTGWHFNIHWKDGSSWEPLKHF